MVEASETALTLVNVRVELFGMARLACGRRYLDLELPKDVSIGDVVRRLSEACPELVGNVILQDLSGLQESYTFNLNGTAFVAEGIFRLKQGDTLLLFSSQAGG